MKASKVLITMGVAAVALTASGLASATNGYMTHGTGTKNKGVAGAGIAQPQDAIDVVNNPAVAALLDDSMQLGFSLFNPNRDYRTSESLANGQGGAFTIGPNDISSDSNYFIIPHFARSWRIDDESAWAVAFYGRGGMNTDWSGGTATFDPDGPVGPAPVMTFPGTYGGGDAGVDLNQAFLDLTWARKLNDRVAYGITGIVAFQAFEAKGVGAFAGYTETFAASGGTVFPQNLSDNGHDLSYGFGARVGLHAALTDTLAFGISYQSKIYMSEFDDYADLFANQGDFDIPADFKVGFTWSPNDTLALSFDIEHVWFSDVDSVGNPIANLFSCPTVNPMATSLSNCLGGDNGAGFGWDDMTVYKIGAQWKTSEEWTWRAGYSTGDQPIPTSEMTFNILAPAVMEDTITVGFTRTLSSGNELNLAFMYAPKQSLSGPNTFDPTQTIEFEMDQYELEMSYSWKF